MNAKELCATLEQHPLISHATDEPTAEQQWLIDAMKPREIVAINATIYSKRFNERAFVSTVIAAELLGDSTIDHAQLVKGFLFDALAETEAERAREARK